MRFEIKDLLQITLLAAIAFLVYQSGRNVAKKRLAVQRMSVETNRKQMELAALFARLESAPEKIDFLDQVSQLHESAIESYQRILEKYGKVTVQPNKVGLRLIPMLKKGDGNSPVHFRIAVPEEYPVFLRSAMSDAESIPSAKRRSLDEQAWLEKSIMSDSRKLQKQLTPGIHDLIFTTYRPNEERQQAMIEISLDGSIIFQTSAREPGARGTSSSYTSPSKQYDFDFRYGTKRLIRVGLDDEAGRDLLEFWVWLSGNETAKGFQTYRLDGEADE